MAKVIMVQGTMSSAGKSFLVAGLCRIFRQDGYRVAPFKSQNMALNSYITDEGLEMGRAQVTQAEAAGIRPEICMNPILLKPTSSMGSQVIVNGEVRGNYAAAEYFRMKRTLIPDILRAYENLASRFDIIVCEGAGSPAEINLKADDIVNMGLAKLLDAPVLLAGDIDRGGVFAQLYGTVALLEEEERRRIRGLVINKFRGDRAILEPGLLMLYERCRIPVAGVVPYMEIDIDDEDSLAARLSPAPPRPESGGRPPFARIAVIRLPRISNFTDFNVLERLPGVSLSYVSRVSELGRPDMVILPGSKNTMEDLRWLRQNGLESAVMKCAADGAVVFGICGGYQMLGRRLDDPLGVEGGGRMRGMGLLPVETVFRGGKTRARVEGTAGVFGGASLSGYEIHMGETKRKGGEPFAKIVERDGHAGADGMAANQNAADDGEKARAMSKERGGGGPREDGCVFGNIYGTYLHGVFDSEAMQDAVWTLLSERKGCSDRMSANHFAGSPVDQYKDRQYDKLAAGLRESLDMDFIYRILDKADI